MFRKFVQSNYDVDKDVLETIKYAEILQEEHKHINSLLQQNGMFSSKFLIFVIGLIVTGLSTMLWQMHSFFIIQLPTMKNLSDLSSEVESLMSDVMIFSIGFYILFLMVMISTTLYGFGLKKRKKIIINLLNEIYIKAQDAKEKTK